MRFVCYMYFLFYICPYIASAALHEVHPSVPGVDIDMAKPSFDSLRPQTPIKTSSSYSDRALEMRMNAKMEGRALSHKEAVEFASLIIAAVPLEAGQCLYEASQYIENIPGGKALLDGAKSSRDYSPLEKFIIDHEVRGK